MGKKYNNSPIVEAVCEFRFQPGAHWQPAFLNQIREHLKDVFPKKRMAQAFEASFSIVPQGNQQNLKMTDRLQLLSDNENVMVQIDVDLLAINQLKPYTNWESFIPHIKNAFAAYREVVQPKGVHRIGLRYINHIIIPGEQVQLEDHLNFFPALNWQLSEGYSAFIVGLQIPFDGTRDILNMQLASASSNQPNTMGIILDLDYFLGKSREVSFENVNEWLAQAHNRVEEAFEGCIKDSLRNIFKEEKE